jgi:hypothetical protein
MNGIDFLHSLGFEAPRREVEWLDVLVYAQEQNPEPGGAARWLADEMGVSTRSAERYLAIATPGVKETQMPVRHAQVEAAERLKAEIKAEWDEEDSAAQRQQIADLLRLISHVSPGKVGVQSRSGPQAGGSRSIGGELDVDLDAVADAWEDDDEDLAAAELSDAIVSAYGQRGGVDSLDDALRITDYPPGLDWR